MQIGNSETLNAERNALRDQFDAVWLASNKISAVEARAIRCALALDKPNMSNHLRANRIIGNGWSVTAPAVIHA
jgi:hypothetical protein